MEKYWNGFNILDTKLLFIAYEYYTKQSITILDNKKTTGVHYGKVLKRIQHSRHQIAFHSVQILHEAINHDSWQKHKQQEYIMEKYRNGFNILDIKFRTHILHEIINLNSWQAQKQQE